MLVEFRICVNRGKLFQVAAVDESIITVEEIAYLDGPGNGNRSSDNELIGDNVENLDENSCKSLDLHGTSDNIENENIDCNICGKFLH